MEVDFDGLDDWDDHRLDNNIFSAIRLIEASKLRLNGKNALGENSSDPSRLQMLFKRLLAIQKLSEISKKYAAATPEATVDENAKEPAHNETPQAKDKIGISKEPEKLDHYKFFEKPVQFHRPSTVKPATKAKLLSKSPVSESSTSKTTKALSDKNSQITSTTPSTEKSTEQVTRAGNDQEQAISTKSSDASTTGVLDSPSDADANKSVSIPILSEQTINGTSITSSSTSIPILNETEPSNEHEHMLTKQNEDYLEQILQEAILSLKSQNINYMDMIDSIFNKTNDNHESQENVLTAKENYRQRNDKRAIEDDLEKIMTSWDNVDLTTLLQSETTNPANATFGGEQGVNEEERDFITASTLSLLRSLPNDLDQLKEELDEEERDLEESLTPEQLKFLSDLWQRSKRSIYRNLRRQRLNSGKKKKNKHHKPSLNTQH